MRHELSNGLLLMAEQMAPIFDAADGMRADLEKRGWSPTAAEQVALAWLMARPSITAPIASATSVEQLDELIGAAHLQLSRDEIARLDTASA